MWLFGLEKRVLGGTVTFFRCEGSKQLPVSPVNKAVCNGPKMKGRMFLSKMLEDISAHNDNFRAAVKLICGVFKSSLDRHVSGSL